MKRIQKQAILKDLEKKIVLLVGPRQAGKTWLAKDLALAFKNSVYLNYDQILDREIINAQSWLPTTDLLILDELHKMENWKNYLKGVYDTKSQSMRILVTGSARLDIYDQLGDSLAGRYFRHRLLPLSLAELTQIPEVLALDRLISRSGFPEPYLAENEVEANRWRLQYINSILSTDVFEMDKIYNFKAMQLVFNLLRSRVGTPVSYQSLAEDVIVSPTTIKKYIQVLEALFVIFRVTPYSKNIARSLLKEPKLYFFDTGLVQGDDGAKLENLVAVSLLKHSYALTDYQAEETALHYLRTKDGMEVDFALTRQEKIESIIEVKLSDSTPSRALIHFHEKYQYPAIQLVKLVRHEHEKNGIKILDVTRFLSGLFL
ncbi:MAG: ATP-binding protein [Deltaproteobacteria bacterium]|nr:ATP-binding protein [Deltaproteobacteria bacterium]